MTAKKAITALTHDEFLSVITHQRFPQYRARQLCEWLYKKNPDAWSGMYTLPAPLRTFLEENFSLFSLELHEAQESRFHDSCKYVFRTHDNHYLESVLITSERRRTICLSTQIGCKYGCSFCASGKAGFVRNLTCAEIVDQIRCIYMHTKKKVTNVVFMGMGEPLDNYNNTLASLEALTSDWGFALGERRITISTVGLVPGIKRFAEERFSNIKLSVSLHAATEEKRKKIMPIAQKYSLATLVKTLVTVRNTFKRAITLEYIVINTVNASPADADQLALIAKKLNAKVNLIGYNFVAGVSFNTPSKKTIDSFRAQLAARNVRTTIRYSAGTDITAACGQLRLLA